MKNNDKKRGKNLKDVEVRKERIKRQKKKSICQKQGKRDWKEWKSSEK